jgi:hypothetical protein
MTSDPFPVVPPAASRLLTAERFQRLADVPPEIEWFANLGNKATRRADENAIGDFMKFTGIVKPEEFRTVNRAHVPLCPTAPAASGLIGDYLEVTGHGADGAGALFRPLRNNCTTGGLERAITPDAVFAAAVAVWSGRRQTSGGLQRSPG